MLRNQQTNKQLKKKLKPQQNKMAKIEKSDSTEYVINPPAETVWYEVDFHKVRDIVDVITILEGMQLIFGEDYLTNNPSLKPYVKLKEEKS